MEYVKLGKAFTSRHMMTLPFTRGLLGPADVTPGAFLNAREDEFVPNSVPATVTGTRARQFALCVLMDSPLLCLCDSPNNYLGQPGLEFYRDLPTTWDETHVLSSQALKLTTTAMKPLRHSLPFILACLVSPALAMDSIDLSGRWKFAPDMTDSGLAATPEQWRFPDSIQLPGQVAAQGFGEKPSMATQWTGVGWRYPELFKEWQAPDNFKIPFFLQPPRRYVGPAWYQREIEIPAGWAGKHTLLHLERVHWQSTVWVDGKEIGRCNSLGTPHECDLGPLPPGKHVLTLRIDNRIVDVNPGYLAHSVTDHTQGNWNGAVGRIELRPVAPLHVHEARIEPSFAGKSVKVIVTANTNGTGKVTAKVRYAGPLRDHFESETVSAELTDGRAELTLPMNREPRAWNEFTPHLYQAEVTLESVGEKDVCRETFGFRDLGKKDGRLAINGRPIFLRGTLECCIFPLTGYPPTDVAAWRRIVKICKAHGLNHMRFHSWCPPEAAFIAADEEGFYFQVEASAWASNGGAEIGSGMPLDDWIDVETARMIREYGNHPSFLMMAYGNEPGGPNYRQWLQEYVARWKAKDARRFWTTAAGWPLMPGSDYHNMPEPRIQGWGQGMRSLINAEAPRTDFDWSNHVKAHPDAPFVSHEVGQWCVYPNYEETRKYTGFFKANNFEVFQEMAHRNGLLPQAKDFLKASGKLQTLCYKHDLEAALRTPGFGGIQLLDLHDFPGQGTALIGVLDPFWKSKGYVTVEEYARFAGPVVPLARLKKMTWQTDETLEADLQLFHFDLADFKGLEPTWKLMGGKTIVAQGTLPARDLAAGGLYDLGTIRVPLDQIKAPAQLKLTVGARGQKFDNDWDLFVYPASVPAKAPRNVTITHSLDEAMAALDEGKTVLWTPPSSEVKDDPARPLVAGFSTIFWNTAWTEWQPPHTLGILCNPKHLALAKFPTDFHSNWQWWELQKDARPFILTKHHELRPVVQLIDDWVTHRKLGYVFEAKVGQGRLLACSFDLDSDLDHRNVARQMRASLLAYVASDRFAPKLAMTKDDLKPLVTEPPMLKKLGAKISASNEEPGYPAAQAMDGNPTTIWHTEYSTRQPALPHDLTVTLPQATTISALLLTQRRDLAPNGQFAEIEILDGKGNSLCRAQVPLNAALYRVALPQPTKLGVCVIRVHKTHSGPFASLAELDVETGGETGR